MLKGKKRSAAEEVLHRDQEYLYGVRPVEAAFSNALLLLQQQQVSTEPQTTATRTYPPPSALPLRRISKLFLLDKPLSPSSSSSFSQQSKEERQEEEATVAGEERRRGEGGGGAKEGSKLAKKGTSKHQAVLQWLEAAAKEELGIPVERVDRRRMEELVGPNNVHQGVVAKVSKLKAKEVPFLEAEEEKERRMSRGRKPLWLVLAEIWDPHNVGAILRTAAFFGVDGVILSAKNSSPLTAHVSKASAGALESMQLYSTRNILRFLAESKKRGWKVFGASSALSDDDDAAEKPEEEEEGEVNTAETKETRENAAKSLQEVSDRDAPSILVVGNEGYGLRKQVIKMCDVLLHIDQALAPSSSLHPRQHLDSLNVSVATGVLLFQLTSTK